MVMRVQYFRCVELTILCSCSFNIELLTALTGSNCETILSDMTAAGMKSLPRCPSISIGKYHKDVNRLLVPSKLCKTNRI